MGVRGRPGGAHHGSGGEQVPPAALDLQDDGAGAHRPDVHLPVEGDVLDLPQGFFAERDALREEILGALGAYEGAVILVSHDEGAVEALDPERVLIMPDGTEDLWSPEYLELIGLA